MRHRAHGVVSRLGDPARRMLCGAGCWTMRALLGGWTLIGGLALALPAYAQEPGANEPSSPAGEVQLPAPPEPDDEFQEIEDEGGGLDGGDASSSSDLDRGDLSSSDPSSGEFVDPAQRWVLDDGHGHDVPWDDFDPRRDRLPRGIFHAGVQARAAILPGISQIPIGPVVEVGLVLDLRYRDNSAWHIRGVFAFAWQNHTPSTASATWLFRLMPLSVELGEWFALRAGGQIGAQLVAGLGGGSFDIHYGASGEAALRLVGGRLELALTGGVQSTAINYGGWTSTTLGGQLGGQIGYLIW